MSTRGYVLNGVYYRAKPVPLATMVSTQQTMFKQGDFARQRFDHAAEILQPYDHKGNPNEKFVEAFPDEAAEYGFIPKNEPDAPKISDTPQPGDPDFGGSVPWGYQIPPS